MFDMGNKERNFPTWLGAQLLRTGLSNRQLAKKLGVRLPLIGKWLRGEVKTPTLENIVKLSEIFQEDINLLKDLLKNNRQPIIEVPVVNPESISVIIETEEIFGRSDELKMLGEYRQRSRLILITGISGIGKSNLAKAFYNSQPHEKILYRCYDNTSIKDIAEYVELFSEYDLICDPIKFILQKLKRDRCLLVLDNLDLDHPEYGDSYNQLLEQIAETEHQSCVIVTSRNHPKGVRTWEPRPKVVTLEGLDEPEAIALLQREGLSPQADKKLVQTLIQKYEGNPWGLKLATQDILELHNGNLAEYLGKTSTVFSPDFSKEIDEIIARLSPLELEILYWLALQNEAIPYPEIRDVFTHRTITLIDGNEVGKAVQELNRRLLIEKDETGITLRTTVQLCTKLQLRKILAQEIKAIAANDMSKLVWLHRLDLVDEQIKLRDRFSRYEPILIQALTQLEPQPKEQTVDEIGYAIRNLRYLLAKPIE